MYGRRDRERQCRFDAGPGTGRTREVERMRPGRLWPFRGGQKNVTHFGRFSLRDRAAGRTVDLPSRPPIHVPVSGVLQFGGGTSRTHRDVSVAGLRRLSRVVDSADRDTRREETRAPGQTSRTFLNLVGSFGARTASNRQSSLTGFGRL